MKKKSPEILIEEIKCGITEGGFACGPVDGNVVVSMKFPIYPMRKRVSDIAISSAIAITLF